MYSLKDIWIFRYSNQTIITLINHVLVWTVKGTISIFQNSVSCLVFETHNLYSKHTTCTCIQNDIISIKNHTICIQHSIICIQNR